MKRRKFLSCISYLGSFVLWEKSENPRYRLLTADEVSFLMDYPILHRLDDWDVQYKELPDNKLCV